MARCGCGFGTKGKNRGKKLSSCPVHLLIALGSRGKRKAMKKGTQKGKKS